MSPVATPAKTGMDQESLKPGEVVVVIPARMGSSRLPGKPLAMVGGAPMVVQVWRRAVEAGFGEGSGMPLVVACDDGDIAKAVEAEGGEAVLTSRDHPSGSDRVQEAVEAIDPEGRAKVVVNLQGDLPEIDASVLWLLARALAKEDAAIATPVAPLAAAEKQREQVVKAVVGFPGEVVGDPKAGDIGRALAFTRHPDAGGREGGDGKTKVFHHIGIYAWQRQALARFVGLPPSPLEEAEQLEQLRALEDGMKVVAVVVDSVPGGIDTPEDLAAARERFGDTPPRKE